MGRALGLAVAIRELVATTDSLAAKVLLRDGGDASLFRWKLGVERDRDWCVNGVARRLRSICEGSKTANWQKGVVGLGRV